MSDYYHPDISNSSLYNKSVDMDCMLQIAESVKYQKLNHKINNFITEEASTMMREYIDPIYEHKLRTDQYNNQYRCYVNPIVDERFYSDCLGFECNTNMLYKLDDFNTYHNYPVCKVRDNNEITCCPENVQIFDNMTRRNVEIPDTRPKYDLIVDKPMIPKLVYNKC